MSKKSRYGIEKVEHNGIKFDSRREMKRYLDLFMLQAAGQIRDLQYHKRIHIVIGGTPVVYPSGRKMSYIADFVYYDNVLGREIVEDIKMSSGYLTETYKIKRALLFTMGIKINEVR